MVERSLLGNMTLEQLERNARQHERSMRTTSRTATGIYAVELIEGAEYIDELCRRLETNLQLERQGEQTKAQMERNFIGSKSNEVAERHSSETNHAEVGASEKVGSEVASSEKKE